jgi:hypothetical protein
MKTLKKLPKRETSTSERHGEGSDGCTDSGDGAEGTVLEGGVGGQADSLGASSAGRCGVGSDDVGSGSDHGAGAGDGGSLTAIAASDKSSLDVGDVAVNISLKRRGDSGITEEADSGVNLCSVL